MLLAASLRALSRRWAHSSIPVTAASTAARATRSSAVESLAKGNALAMASFSSSAAPAAAAASTPPSGSGALVVAEHSLGKLSPSTLSTVAAAARLLRPGSPISVLVAGDDEAHVASAAEAAAGAVAAVLRDSPSSSRVLTAVHPRLGHGLAEALAQLVSDLSAGGQGGSGGSTFAAVAAPGSTFGRNFLPRAAALASRDMVSDVVSVDAEKGTLTRPIYAGAALEEVEFGDGGVRFFTARPSAFSVSADSPSSTPPLPIEALSSSEIEASVSAAPSPSAEWVEDSGGAADGTTERPDLGSARVVVSGGRALSDADGFAALGRLADAFGPGVAAVGASRAAVDAGIAPNELQVGQTGRVVAPELYVAVGISGAAQHVAGMKSSKCVVAINTDGDAPIFGLADYGLVEDWRTALPRLEEEVRKRRKG